ncbi:MAG: bifunctional aldolase/short-chain dehydrogenase [Desulfuromonas sp.]|nr:MAG: bifunctional aldolase/short-chain dehydrogenase [Desulfuromonas sp.]
MQSLWSDNEANDYPSDLDLRVYTSRLLGRDPSLVLHGGGNTSVKITEHNLIGEEEEILYVKGSGWDLATIETAGFAPVRMEHLLKLAELDQLSDPQMVNELKTHMTRADAPSPSIETILHALLPHKYVDHTHADAIVAITNNADGETRIRDIYGDRIVVIPYVMAGFDLARECARRFKAEAGPQTVGMVLLNHGIFSFGATAKESYERMISLVDEAESYLQNKCGDSAHLPGEEADLLARRLTLAELRRDISTATGRPMLLHSTGNPKGLAFARHPEVARISQQGPATPDHIIRTKRLPMLGPDVEGYVNAYRDYFETNAPNAKEPKTMLDPAPRAVLDPNLGLCTVGKTIGDAQIVADIYDHTIDVILKAEALGGYQALPAADLFDMEYWDLEQAKLRKGGSAPMFQGEVALVTGAASGIGAAAVREFLSRGAAVVGLDIDPAVTQVMTTPGYHGIVCDITDEQALRDALETAVRSYGGIDMLVLNAGIFPGGCRIDQLDTELWHKVMGVNLDANLALLRECHPLLCRAPQGGRVVVVGSKNVPAPGPGAAAYSASKAALTQLMRVAALEWGGDGIRINALHPNAVFDTGIWTEEVLAERAKHYGLTVEEYKTNNVLKVEVTSHDVAALAAEMCGPLFAKTTAAQLPVDGGNERVI